MTDGLWLELISVYCSQVCTWEKNTILLHICFLPDSCEEIKAAHPEANIRSVIKHKRGQLKKAVCLWKSPSMKMCNINKARAFEKRSLPSWRYHPKGKAYSKLLLNSQRPFCHQAPNCSLQTRDDQPPARPKPPHAFHLSFPPKHCPSSAGIGITH